MVEDLILASLTPRVAATGVSRDQARARGRLILWLRDATVDAQDAVFRLSVHDNGSCHRRHIPIHVQPLPDPTSGLVSSFLRRVKGDR